MMPDDAVRQYIDDNRSIVIALTYDPKLDDLVLLEALETKAFYVGAIGSEHNCQAHRSRLQQMGSSGKQVKRLYAPVGLNIGSNTPAEMSVSIMAEITVLRNAVRVSKWTVTAA